MALTLCGFGCTRTRMNNAMKQSVQPLDKIEDTGRSRILAAATRLFAKAEPNAVTLRDIAKEADLQPPSIYHHFKTKEEIYCAVVEKLDLPFRDLIAKLEDKDVDFTNSAELTVWMRQSITIMFKHPALWQVLIRRYAGKDQTGSVFSSSELAKRFLKAATAIFPNSTSHVQPPSNEVLMVLFMFYGMMVFLLDSDIQQEILGGSIYENKGLRDRLMSFATTFARPFMPDR